MTELSKLEQSLKDRDLIDIGDEVEVITTPGFSFWGIVKYKPQATGDCWIFEELIAGVPNGKIRYVQNYIEIIKYKKFDDI